MRTVNEKLQDAEIGHAVDLQHLSNAEVRKILKLLNRVDADLRARLIAAIERMGSSSFTVEHMNTILASVRELNRQVYAEVGQAVTQSLDEIAVYEIGFQQRLFTAVIPPQVLVAVPLASVTLDQVREIAFRRPFQGRLLSEWLADLETTRAARVRDAIRIGMVEGQTTPEIVRRIMGIRSEGFADGLLNRSRQDIEAMVRTAIGHTTGAARDAFYAANDDLIAGEQWLSTLDSRTSEGCRIRDRLKYTAGTHKPVGHSVPWGAGPGRLHWQCRSTSTPITKSWQELGLDIDEIDEGTRASMDGQVPASTTYGEWLERQSAARQDQVLGPERGKLMRQGGLTMDRFYNDKGRYLTLDELKERDAAAFEKAGL
ncbi:hypothetical protein D9M71_33930 [compost metagenome]